MVHKLSGHIGVDLQNHCLFSQSVDANWRQPIADDLSGAESCAVPRSVAATLGRAIAVTLAITLPCPVTTTNH